MSLSSEAPRSRGRVLHGADVSVTAADLSRVSARPARALVVDPGLIEDATREGYEAGYGEGFDQGYADGLAAAHRHTELLGGLVQRLGQASEVLMQRETTARHDIEDQVVETAFLIAGALIGRELERPEPHAVDAIARALRLAPEDGLVMARLNPADLVAIGDINQLGLGRALELVPDASIPAGDCVIDIGACRVDARIASALTRVREVLS
jgi:flagellar assembly protein FliH